MRRLAPVDVPPEYAAIGYSGQFHLDVPVDPDLLDLAIHAMPGLIEGNWLVLRGDRRAGTVTVVREDAAALEDLYHEREMTVPLNLLKIRPWE